MIGMRIRDMKRSEGGEVTFNELFQFRRTKRNNISWILNGEMVVVVDS